MPSCDRCGRDSEDGATLEESLEGDRILCIVCIDALGEKEGARRYDQASLEDYS